jgi:hypothetical protein
LHRTTVEADDHFEQFRAQHRRAELFLLRDDLQQHRPRQVVARLVVDHLDLLARHDQLAQIIRVTWRLSAVS